MISYFVNLLEWFNIMRSSVDDHRQHRHCPPGCDTRCFSIFSRQEAVLLTDPTLQAMREGLGGETSGVETRSGG